MVFVLVLGFVKGKKDKGGNISCFIFSEVSRSQSLALWEGKTSWQDTVMANLDCHPDPPGKKESQLRNFLWQSVVGVYLWALFVTGNCWRRVQPTVGQGCDRKGH